MREHVPRNGLDEDPAVRPHEMELRVLRQDDFPALEHLFVQRADVRAGLRGHQPEVGGQGVEVRGKQLSLQLLAAAVRAEMHPWSSGQGFALCVVCSDELAWC